MAAEFKGKAAPSIDDSTPAWSTYCPKDAPNVLVILFDDTGLATWSPFGARVEMPTLDRLAKNGQTYSQWHTVELCLPTRSCLSPAATITRTGTPRSPEVATEEQVREPTLPFHQAWSRLRAPSEWPLHT